MAYSLDIYDLTNIGIVFLVVYLVFIVLWSFYDWKPKAGKKLENYNWFDIVDKEKK